MTCPPEVGRPRCLLLVLPALVLLGAGCDNRESPAPLAADQRLLGFVDVTFEAGVDFVHENGADGQYWLPEIMGGGGGFFDANGNGLLDLYLVQSGVLGRPDPNLANVLYRNNGPRNHSPQNHSPRNHEPLNQVTFTDVTDIAGVGDAGYGMGCAAGDIDNDGHIDLYVTNLGANVLYRNNGDGTFTNITVEAGVGDEGWSTSAAFVDVDHDGWLDLFVTNYVDWAHTPRFTQRRCYSDAGLLDYCSPLAYDAPAFDTLYRNRGSASPGGFDDISAASNIRSKAGTGLGVVCVDLNLDGLIDIYVSNDQMPSFAWINQGDGTFVERAVPLGVAVDEFGKSQAGMGVDAADINNSGRPDLFKVHLYRETHILYVNHERYFDDATTAWGLGATRPFTGFGAAMFDYDLDGSLDMFIANGRVMHPPGLSGGVELDDIYAEPNQLLRQVRPGRMEDVSDQAGPALQLIENSRAAAFGDYDNDGDIDILIVNCGGRARLLRNDTARSSGASNFATIRVLDENGRDAFGARLLVTFGEITRAYEVKAAFSYCATNDPRVHVGLGAASRVERVEVRWPDGSEKVVGPLEANRFHEIRQGASSRSTAAPAEPSLGALSDRDVDVDEDFEPQRDEFMRIADALYAGNNPFLGTGLYRTVKRDLDRDDLPQNLRIQGRLILATELLRLGREDDAIKEVEAVYEEVGSDPRFRSAMPSIYQIRGLVYLRKAEVENCIRRHNAECCIFPLRGGGLHEVSKPAERAFESYLAALAYQPSNLRWRWLLNIVAMALDRYPDSVPERFLISPSAFESDEPFPRFVDQAPQLGLADFNLCGGVAAEDFTGNGFIDLITTSYDPKEHVRLYGNTGTGTFEDLSKLSRLDDQFGGLNLIAADFNNSGAMDVLILRGAWLLDDGQIRNSLLRNDGPRNPGRFTDITRTAGIAEPAAPTQTAVFGDFNNNGLLDLYIGNESRFELDDRRDYPNQLFQNGGDETFTDIAREAGVTNNRYTKGVAAGDSNNNGHLDLYVSNVGANRLYRNNGDGTFTDVALDLGVHKPTGRSFACWFFDYDNDGWLDIYVAGFNALIEHVAADYLGLPNEATPPALYRNNGPLHPGTFTNVTKEVGLHRARLPMGANFGDIDFDGFLDIYLGTGDPDFQTLMPNVMLRNDNGKRFLDVTTASGTGHLQKGHGIAFADFNHNGRQDIFHQLGGFYPGDKFNNVLFVNPGPPEGSTRNRFLVVRLVGTQSNRSAIGARITVNVQTPRGKRSIHRAVGSVSSFGGSPLRQEIGLGDATAIESLEIWWPKSNIRQRFTDVTLDAFIRITEGEEAFERLPYEPFKYGER